MASTYLTKTFGTSTNNKKWTMSVWFKAANIGGNDMAILSTGVDTSNRGIIYLRAQGDFQYYEASGGSTVLWLETNEGRFRDCNGWYHIVVSSDTTQATSSNRVKIYVNGSQITSGWLNETYPSLNYDSFVNKSSARHDISGRNNHSNSDMYWDGSMAHYHFVDGTAYDASTFGETDATTGIWKPKTAPSVTYGTNGFFLKFANSGSMGTDSSGNGNNFTVNGTLTQTQDTPSNVFCCLNPLKKHSGQTLSYLNLRNVGAGSANIVGSTFAPSQGKWYFEFKLVSANAYAVFLYPQNLYQVGDDLFGSNYTTAIYATDPSLYRNGSNAGNLGGGVANNDIIQVAMDLDSNNIYFGKNGNWNDGLGGGFDQSDFSNATGHTLTRNSSFDEIGIATLNGGSGSSYTLDWNFGNGYFGTTAVSSSNADGAGLGLFEYAPPTGYYSLCTKNINTYG
jgi:hypothetical protein